MKTGVLYTQERCQPCNATKRRLDSLEVEAIEVDLTQDTPLNDVIRAELRAQGWRESPIVKILEGGEYVDAWSGYRPDKIDEHFAA